MRKLSKIFIILLPGTKNWLDGKLKAPESPNEGTAWNIAARMGNLVTTYADNIIWKGNDKAFSEALESLFDLTTDLLLWILSASVSILGLIGVILESITGFVATLLRSLCNDSSYSLRGSLKDFLKSITEITDLFEELVDANIRWSIDDSITNTNFDCPVPESVNNKVSAFSFSAQRSNYTDSGVRYDFELKDGIVHVTTQSSLGTGHRAPRRSGTYSFKMPSIGKSFHKKRDGEDILGLKFDMLAASNDRVFVKVNGTSDFYFAIMDELFWGNNQAIPSIYFKLDPQLGETDNNGNPLDPSPLVKQIPDDVIHQQIIPKQSVYLCLKPQ